MDKVRNFSFIRYGQVIALLLVIIWPFVSLCKENIATLNVTSLDSWGPYVKRLYSSLSNKSFDDASLLKPEHYFGDQLVLITPAVACRSRGTVTNIIEKSLNDSGYVRSFDTPKEALKGCITLVNEDKRSKKILRTCVRTYSYFGLCKYSTAMFGVELEVQGAFAEEKNENRDKFIGNTIEILARTFSSFGGHLDTSK